jgi:hypothetical protein
MTLRSPRVVLGAAVVAIALVALAVTLKEEPPHTTIIETSGTFDTSNLAHLAGYADNIFVGTVQTIEGVDDGHTQYRVAVEETVKGDLSGDVVVSQLGYVTDNETHMTEDQPLLVVGDSYLLVTNPDTVGRDWQSLVTGATSAVTVEDDNRKGVIERYRGATARQVYPPGLPPKAEPQE